MIRGTTKYTRKYDDFIKTHYPDEGMQYIIQETGLSYRESDSIIRRLNLRINREKHNARVSEIRRQNYPSYDRMLVNHEDLLNVNSDLKAYVLGLLWSDGSLFTNGVAFGVKLSSTEPDSFYFYPQFIKTGKWRYYSIELGGTYKPKVSITTHNRYFYKALVDLGFSERSKGFSKILNHIPTEYQRYWLLGFSDGDGCVRCDISRSFYTFSYTSCYEQNWDDIKCLMENLGILSSIKRSILKIGKNSIIQITNQQDVKKWGDFMYYDTDLGLTRKRDKFDEISKICSRKNWRFKNQRLNE